MKLYIASPLAESQYARQWAETLRAWGHTVTSTWHDQVEAGAVDPHAQHVRSDILTVNLRDLEAADVVLALMRAGTPRATYGEIGYAIALGKRVLWLQDGERTVNTCIFDAHSLSTVLRWPYEVLEWVTQASTGEALDIGAIRDAVREEKGAA